MQDSMIGEHLLRYRKYIPVALICGMLIAVFFSIAKRPRKFVQDDQDPASDSQEAVHSSSFGWASLSAKGGNSFVSGTITDPDDQPIENAQISATHLPSGQTFTFPRTAKDGNYRLSKLPAEGTIHVVVKAPGYLDHDERISCSFESQVIDIALQKRRDIEGLVTYTGSPVASALVYVTPDVQVITDAEGRFRLSNLSCEDCHLLSEKDSLFGEKLARRDEDHIEIKLNELRHVELRPHDALSGSDIRTKTCRAMATDGDGFTELYHNETDRALVANLPVGKYTIKIECEGYQASSLEAMIQQNRTLDTSLKRGYELRGIVLTRREFQNGVMLCANDEQYNDIACVNTDGQGRFQLASLPPGRVRLTVHDMNHASFEKWIQVPASQDIVITLVENASAIVEVVNDQRRPISGVQVNLRSVADSNLLVTAISDSNGQARLDRLRSGEYRIEVSHSDYLQEQERRLSVQVGFTQRAYVSMTKGLTLAGVVEDNNHNALAGTSILLLRNGQFIKQAETDEKGLYMLSGLQPGAYSIVARYHDPFAGSVYKAERIVTADSRADVRIDMR